MKVLVSDTLSEVGLKVFKEAKGIEVDYKTGLSPEELKKIIGQYEGLAIRSATTVTADIIDAATNLRVIGRAGIGLDNVDIPAASRKGIVVMNTPDGNTITTAEHTMSMIMSLARNIPQATASLKAGKWEKNRLEGRELFNKTLGLLGAGHIGQIVADRANGMKMKVIVYDPYIKPEIVEKLSIEPVSLDELFKRSDFITIHTPKTEETTNLINKDNIAKMKKGAMIINCARGGIVNEKDLYDALKSGYLGGAAVDVFEKEPPGTIPLMELPNFICTPHLGASTLEAQENVAKDVAEQIVDFLINGTVKNAVNVPCVSSELMSILKPYATLVEKMGIFHTQLADSSIDEVHINYSGKVAEYDVKPLTSAALKGLLTPILKDDVNFINASFIAKNRGIKVVESRSNISDDFASLIFIKVKYRDGENIISGTIFGNTMPRILRINDFYLEAIPEGHNLLLHNLDVPGMIGRIATTMGDNGINIERMAVSQDKSNNRNIILLATDVSISDNVLKKLGNLENVFSVKRIEL